MKTKSDINETRHASSTGSATGPSMPKSRENLRALTEAALLITIGFVLSWFRLLPDIWPYGGSVTPLSMLPLLMIGLRRGLKWGLGSGVVYACLQMLQGISFPPAATAAPYISVILLDYIVAFTVLGLSGLFKGRKNGLLYAIPLCLFLRFLCHFTTGIFIWDIYAEGMPPWLYSLSYNGPYMAAELVFTMITGAILCKTTPMLFTVKPR